MLWSKPCSNGNAVPEARATSTETFYTCLPHGEANNGSFAFTLSHKQKNNKEEAPLLNFLPTLLHK